MKDGMGDVKLGLLVALSAGGSNDELAVHGIGLEHVEELMVRMAMRLLADGNRLSFGGTLGDPGKDLTRYLIETAERWLDDKAAEKVHVTKPETWPLVNYSAWPNHETILDDQRAKLVGICQFVNIGPGVSEDILKQAASVPAQKNRYLADALTAMRERSAQEADLRVVWSGRINGAKGWMAGILEEIGCTLRLNKPLIILGGFGGCARVIADFLNDLEATWPEPLSLSACADPERDALLTDSERTTLENRIQEAERLLTEFRAKLYSEDSINGISTQLIRNALLDENSRSVISKVAEAAASF